MGDLESGIHSLSTYKTYLDTSLLALFLLKQALVEKQTVKQAEILVVKQAEILVGKQTEILSG